MKALEYARQKHEGQTRKGGEPYVHHLVRVAGYASIYVNESSDVRTICLLHDVLEDTDASYEELSKLFGYTIAGAVADLTNEFTKEDYPHLKRRERKIKEAERLGKCSDLVKSIKLCDRYDNVSDKLLWLDKEFADRYIRETYELIEKIGSACPALTKLIRGVLHGYDSSGKDEGRCNYPL